MPLRGLASQGEMGDKDEGQSTQSGGKSGQQRGEERREYQFIHSSALLNRTWENKGSLKLILP